MWGEFREVRLFADFCLASDERAAKFVVEADDEPGYSILDGRGVSFVAD